MGGARKGEEEGDEIKPFRDLVGEDSWT